MPAELIAPTMSVSANVCRTMDASAASGNRCSLLPGNWLEAQGFERWELRETQLRSPYAFLASAARFAHRVNVFNHCPPIVADVSDGLSTQHVRQGLEKAIDLDSLRNACGRQSVSYMDISPQEAKVHCSFTPRTTPLSADLSRDIIAKIKEHGIVPQSVVLPLCATIHSEIPLQISGWIPHLFVPEKESLAGGRGVSQVFIVLMQIGFPQLHSAHLGLRAMHNARHYR